ncbi:MAG: type II secretion system protein GspD, partial [Halanaerobiales bacterium]
IKIINCIIVIILLFSLQVFAEGQTQNYEENTAEDAIEDAINDESIIEGDNSEENSNDDNYDGSNTDFPDYDDIIVTISVRGAEIKDVLMMLTEQSGINLVPDETVQGQVTIDLKNVEIMEAMRTLTIAYGYHFNMIADNIFMVSREGYQAPADIRYQDGLLTIRVENGDVRKVINQIADLTNINIIMNEQIQGTVSANLTDVPLEIGLSHFLQANGFSLSMSDGIYRIYMAGRYDDSNLAISVKDGLVTIDVRQADLAEVIRTISRLADINMVVFSGVRDVVDLKLDDVPVDEAIDIILSGTRFGYIKSQGVYLIGDKNGGSPSSSLITESRIIPLEYLEVEKVPALLPHNFPPSNVKVLTEQNALLVTGTNSEIDDLTEYIAKLDTKIPLIVVDALILELNRNESEGPEMKLGMNYEDNEEKVLFDSLLGKLNYRSVLELPSDFYLKVNSMVSQNQATIKARPNITTLNGQQASIDVGTVQYYKVVNTDNDGNEDTKYQSVNGGVTLQVTPWVSSSGEITIKLKPTVSNIGAPSSGGPPQISRRAVETTVRVRDGQTIVIGGLIQNIGSNIKTNVPFLSEIPIIGGLFKSDNSDINMTELVMYITPRVLSLEEENVVEEMQQRELELDSLYEEE